MNLRIVFKFRDCNLQFYKKRRLFCYFSVNPRTPASRWRRLLKLKRKKKNCCWAVSRLKKTGRFHRKRLTARSKNNRLNCIAVQFSTVKVLFSWHELFYCCHYTHLIKIPVERLRAILYRKSVNSWAFKISCTQSKTVLRRSYEFKEL